MLVVDALNIVLVVEEPMRRAYALVVVALVPVRGALVIERVAMSVMTLVPFENEVNASVGAWMRKERCKERAPLAWVFT